MRLTGECGRCGLCCTGTWIGRPFRCEHLVISDELGQPEATHCGVYERRTNGMPVTWLDRETGAALARSWCWKDSPAETALILPHVGQGCTLQADVAA